MDIGRRLRIARKAMGFTQKKASQRSEVGESSISAFEHSEREPSFSQLARLAEVYRKPIEFFLTDKPLIENVMLWCDPPAEEERKACQMEFEQLCRQYQSLETVMGQRNQAKLPQLDIRAEEFSYRYANRLAEEAQKDFSLGEIPSMSLKKVLEEKFCVKLFHLEFEGSAISTMSEEFGPAILLNRSSKSWRRNYDLAHELFHLLTWNIFRIPEPDNAKPSEDEERFANAFASRLLLPTDPVKDKIESVVDEKGRIGFEALDEIAREFGVSLDALLWRLLYLYNKPAEEIETYTARANHVKRNLPPRKSDKPDKLPERYCSLAIRALREGKLSLMQFAKYMGISYKKAQEYLIEDEGFKDEKISIPTT